MKRLIKSFITSLLLLCGVAATAQEYVGVVTLVSLDDKQATFTSVGVADKKADVQINAIQSLFHTLFHNGVHGINNGKPLVSNDNPSYTSNFINVKAPYYASNVFTINEPAKNSQKKLQGTYRINVPIQNLYKELAKSGVSGSTMGGSVSNVDDMSSVTLPTVIVVPFKSGNDSYETILKNDADRRVAVAMVQDGFESRDITTIDIVAKIDAMKRRAEYEANTASSNDKNLLLSSGADVYVTVDVNNDVQPAGTRASLIMKAYETASGSILATKTGFSNRFRTTAMDALYAFVVKNNIQAFMDDIVKNLNKQVSSSKRVTLQISVAGNSMTTLDDAAGPNNYSISNIIRQWVRVNAENGKYHLQGAVAESMVFDYVMIPPKDSDGLMMDAAQFAFLLQSYLAQEQGISCSSKVDGTTIYITIN